ncbi:YhdP family protein [Tahibacter amnicola]|uniref:YhdP family protein n=1 Tax=Tahibacter amnicola TaxID=2976241 RepID=A0ABY6BJH9_9GAMM|nr:YhdP family protein [Tahibacter amnicola]UXI69924.1 YhdP family protein [Tahibacter amnicola]
MTPWRRRLRRLRLWLTVLSAGAIILAAVVVGLTKLLLPQVSLHRERVAAFLSERVHRPVSLDKVEGFWEGGGPILRLEGVHIAAADPALPPIVIPQAELVLDFTAGLRRNRRWSEFRLNGLDLTLERADGGRWSISGLSGSTAPDSGDNPLMMLGALVVRNSRLRIIDVPAGIDAALRADELRLLNQGSHHRVLGILRRDSRAGAPVELVAEYDESTRKGVVYAGGRAIDLADLAEGLAWRGLRLAEGRGRLQVWASVADDRFATAHVAMDLTDIRAASAASSEPVDPAANADAAAAGKDPAARDVHLASLSGVARWQRVGPGWQLDVAQLKASIAGATPAPSFLSVRQAAPDADMEFNAEQVDLTSIAALVRLSGQGGERLQNWLTRSALRGRVEQASLRLAPDGGSHFAVSGRLAEFGADAVDRIPGIDALNGELLGDEAGIVLTLPPQSTTFRYPRKFREPFAWPHLAGRIAAFPIEDGWRIETDALDIDGQGYALQLRGGVEFVKDGNKPLLDVYAVVLGAEVTAAKQFWPIGDMSRNTVNWLDRGLISGKVTHGRAVIHADLDDWPLRNLAGRFGARAEIDDLVLDYSPNWPRAERVSAVAEFVNQSMRVEATGGTVLGTETTRAVADIPEFKDAVLSLDVEGQGTGAQLLGVVHASPLGKRYADELRGITVGGRGVVKFRLDMPFKPGAPDVLRGTVDLTDSVLTAKKWDIDFSRVNGRLAFTGDGFIAPFDVDYAGKDARFTLAVGKTVSDATNAVEASLEGHLPVSDVFADFEALKPWWPNFPGSSDWRIDVAVPREAAPTRLRARSELRGTAFILPPPLDKAAGDAMPVELSLQLPVEGSPLHMTVGDVFRLEGRLPDATRAFAAAVAVGAGELPAMPQEGVTIAGHTRIVDLSAWTGLGVGAGPSLLRSIDLKADVARLGGRDFENLGLVLAEMPDQVGVSFSGPTLQGTLQIPRSDLVKRGITAQFERLHWPEPKRLPTEGPVPPPDETDPMAGAIPAMVPPLHVWIGDFRLGAANFGETRFESTPIDGGMKIEQFDTRSSDMQMHVRGEWRGDGKSQRTEVDMDLTAENLGRMLGALGFSGLFEGGQTLAHLSAGWDGSPAVFALARLDGRLRITVNAGRVLDVEPGMGRLFGLFSIREIPRRLALDFGDFFQSGMSFNAIKGEFELRGGSAYTQNLSITSPAADIRISGRTGLRDKDYDQQMVVTPHVGGTLPVVGALAGGPAGAAAGLAVQTLFNRAINQVTTARYQVTGSWEKPDITLTAREGGRRRKDDSIKR